MKTEFMEEEISLLDYYKIIKKRWYLIFLLCIVSGSVSLILSFRAPRIYMAATSIYVFSSGGGQMLSQVPQSLLGLVGISSPGGQPQYIEKLLKSDSLALSVAEKMKLAKKKEFSAGKKISKQKLVEILKSKVKIGSDKAGPMFTISCEAQNPKLAADIANTYVETLRSSMTSKVKKNVLFLEVQLKQAQSSLTEAEDALKLFQKANKIYALDKELEGKVNAYLSLKSEEMKSRMELDATRKLIQASGSLENLSKLEGQKISFETKQSEIQSALSALDTDLISYPEKAQQYAKLLREIKLQALLVEFFSQQYQMERVSQLKEDVDFQVIDKAYPPEKNIKPTKKKNLIVALSAGLVVGILLVFMLDFFESEIKKNTLKGEQLV